MKKVLGLAALLCLLLPLSGCEAVYDIGQEQAQRDCARLTDNSAYQDCMRRNRESFKDYEQKREKAKKGG